MRHRFVTTDVFTKRIFGGNPLAVFPDAEGIDPAQMQRIAGEFNLSETVFVLPPRRKGCARRLRIFTPSSELPFAGHPTLGAAFVLAAGGALPLEGDAAGEILLEEEVGPVAVRIESQGGRPMRMELTAPQLPELGPAPAAGIVAETLSLAVDDLDPHAPPAAVSCGVPYLFVPLRDREALGRARLDAAAWQRHLAESWAPSLYLTTRDADPPAQLRARMFAPGHGVAEDPATGSAVAALGGVLAAQVAPDACARFVVEQGVEMGRPSRLELEVVKRGDVVAEVKVGGAAVLVSEGSFEVPA